MEKEQLNQYSVHPPEFPVSAITPAKAQMLTHINFAFLNINEAGECALEQGSDETQAATVFAELRQLRQYNPALRLMFSLGGWAFSNDQSATVARYHAAASAAPHRRRLAQSCVAFMQRYGFDGIDVDWEYPRAGDAASYVALLRELRLQLRRASRGRAHAYQLSIAAAADAPSLARTYRHLSAIARQVDYINLMAYDLNGPWQQLTNHNAHLYADPAEPKIANPLRDLKFWPTLSAAARQRRFPSPLAVTVDSAVTAYLHAAVPARKLVLGVPFYGRAYFSVAGTDEGLYQAFTTPSEERYQGDPSLLYGCMACAERHEPRLASYAEIQQLVHGDFGYTRYFGEHTKAPWLYHAQKKIFVSYDDTESLSHKTAYLQRHALAGAMFWHLGHDDAQGTLLSSLYTSLNPARQIQAK